MLLYQEEMLCQKETQRTDKAMAGPAIGHLKHHQEAIPKMEITTAIIHHATMDLGCQTLGLGLNKNFIWKKYGVL